MRKRCDFEYFPDLEEDFEERVNACVACELSGFQLVALPSPFAWKKRPLSRPSSAPRAASVVGSWMDDGPQGAADR